VIGRRHITKKSWVLLREISCQFCGARRLIYRKGLRYFPCQNQFIDAKKIIYTLMLFLQSRLHKCVSIIHRQGEKKIHNLTVQTPIYLCVKQLHVSAIYNHHQAEQNIINSNCINRGKAVPLQAWSGPECSRKLRFPDFVTTAQDGGRL